MDRDELEQELWKLRSAEYDLEQAQARITELESLHADFEVKAKELEANAKKIIDNYERLRDVHESTVKEFHEVSLKKAELEKELKTYHQIDHMKEAYGFVPPLPEQRIKNWRA